MVHSGDKSILKITALSVAIIFVMLLLVYRSVITVVLLLVTVGIELGTARGIVALLGNNNILALSTFSINLLVALGIAVGTDYAIFFFGRYQEARQAGADPETAYYTTYRGVAPVVLASGLTIAGAILCLSFTRMPIFQSMGVPCAVGMFVAVAVALTLVPAVLAVGSGFGLLDPKRRIGVRRWRRVGTAIVRWPAHILVATIAVALVGLVTLPGYKTSYNDRLYIPKDIPANLGYAAADRHFSQSRMMPEILMIESNHDMRNPADFLVLHKLAKRIFRVLGVSRVQAVTRPEGTPIEHTSIPFLISMQNAAQLQNMTYMKERVNDMLKQADLLTSQIALTKRTYELQRQLNGITHHTIGVTKEMSAIVDELEDHISDFEDFFRPIRSYFYWEKHCSDIPICKALKSVFDSIDAIDAQSDKLHENLKYLDKLDVLLPEINQLILPIIATMEYARTTVLATHSTMSGIISEVDESTQNATAMGQAFDAAKNDDSFYLPPEIFQNPDFQRAMDSFLSPDGKAARFIISHKGDPATPEGIARIDQIRGAAEEALKTTPLEDAKIYIAGTASTFKDFRDGSDYDLWIAGVGALCLIFIIMLIITRSLIAALVIVGTVALSLGASFGLSVLIWQYVLGIKLHWMVLPMSVIILLAVGCDYNLQGNCRRHKHGHHPCNGRHRQGRDERGPGVRVHHDVHGGHLRILAQVGTTIGLGLMFDTLVVRSFMTPSIAALLGRWFWWPQIVRPRPASYMLRPLGPRPLVRSLLLREEPHDDDAVTAELPRITDDRARSNS